MNTARKNILHEEEGKNLSENLVVKMFLICTVYFYLQLTYVCGAPSTGPINPGTKWCGDGMDAVRYEDIGVAEETDKCCRNHDHCPLSIPAKTWKYGLYNNADYTNSDCACDSEFRKCLKAVSGMESVVATQVGLAFFTFLTPDCFFAMHDTPCEQRYYDQYNTSYKHDGGGQYFCARWFINIGWV